MLGLNGGRLGSSNTPTGSTARGIWIPNEQVLAKRGGAWPAVGDPNWANVTLLMHFNGSNGSTTFVDSSSSGVSYSFSAVGNAAISTAQSKFGGSSAVFDGNNDQIATPVTTFTSLSFGTGDFTVEFFVLFNNVSTDQTIMCGAQSGGGTNAMLITHLVSGGWVVGRHNVANDVVTNTLSTANTWQHVAISRVSSSLRVFLDGTQIGTTATNSVAYHLGLDGLRIGQQLSPVFRYFNGYIDDIRITKGVGRYTANFTPPDAQFPDF